MLAALVFPKSTIPFADADTRPPEELARYSPLKKLGRRIYLKWRAHVTDAGIQALGMVGLFHTYRRTLGGAWQLFGGKSEASVEAPMSALAMREPAGCAATHALP